MTAEAAEMTRAVTVSDEARAAIPDQHWKRLCAAFAFAPYQRCDECGQTIDLRIEAASLIVCLLTDTDGKATYVVSHPLCAPSQVVTMDRAARERANERWFGQPVGYGFCFFEAVSMDDGHRRPVLLVELQNTGLVFHEDDDGGVIVRSDILEALVEEDSFALWSVETGLADLPQAPDWKVLLSPDGALNAVVGVPGRGAVSSAGVFIASGGASGGDPDIVELLTEQGSVTLLVVPPATFGLPKVHGLAEDMSNLETTVTSLIMNAAGLSAKEDPSVPLTHRKAFLRAVADGRIVGARVQVQRPGVSGAA